VLVAAFFSETCLNGKPKYITYFYKSSYQILTMTPKQEEKIKLKIKKIKSALSADRKRGGGYYDDSRGLRYIPTGLYIKLNDYSGGIRYLNWFKKNFPDDMAHPEFLFEWTLTLFKTGRLKEAEKKAFEAFCQNPRIFANFFDRQIISIDKWEGSNPETRAFADSKFNYSEKQIGLIDFSQWLDKIIATEKFILSSNKYFSNQRRLKTEKDTETRRYLIQLNNQLLNEF
jgi:hypothetical protein